MRQATILVVSSILTAIAAFAKPTRSAIAAKGETGRGGTPTYSAKDYVQDGLIALWDGIENVGWGVHDAQATVWKDLSGNNHDLILTNGAHFDATSLVTAGRNVVSALLSEKLPYATVEVCAYRDASRNSSSMVCMGNSEDDLRLLGASISSMQIYNGSYVINFASPVSPSNTWTAVHLGSTHLPYIGGREATGTISSNNWSSRSGNFGLSGTSNYSIYNFVGNYFCVRLYSRPLTAEEVARNHAIDKERFGF